MFRRLSTFLGGLLAGLLASGLLLLFIRPHPRHAIKLLPPPTAAPIDVHVTGAVEHPGVIQIAPGSIVEDALAMVGGTTENADLSRVNLARELSDGQQVFVPANDAGSSPPGTQSTHALTLEKININRADEVELEKLPGIGPSLAASIVEYREKHGWFQDVDELMQVSGIGPAKVQQIEDLITFH